MNSKKLLSSTTFMVVIILALFGQNSNNLVHGDPIEGGENVCTINIPIKKDIKVVIPVEYDIKVHSTCGLMPCTKTRTETKLDESIKTIIQHVQKHTCCPGYTETHDRKCAPICLDSCNNGKCISPNVCKCQPEPTDIAPGFVGPTCNRFSCLNTNKWGSKCDRECNCSSTNSYCSANTGKCLCYPGWRGENCTLECDSSSSRDPQCEGYSALPPIIEPDANVMDYSSSSSRSAKLLQPDALVFEEDKLNESSSKSDSRFNFWIASTLFSLVCWASLIAYLIVVRRNKRPSDDPYYETCSRGSSSGNGYYSGSTYSRTTSPSLPAPRAGDYLGKNLSMTAVIRNTLQGANAGKGEHVESNDRSRPIFAPKIETHLIDSQRRSQKNVYSEPICNFEPQLYATPAAPINTSNLEHIYQVPRSPAAHKSTTTGPSNLEDALHQQQQQQQHDNNSMATISEQRDISEDGVSNIYEELKPRAPEPR